MITCDLADRDRADLIPEIHRYQQRTPLLGAIVGLLITMLRVSKVRLDYERLRDHESMSERPVASNRTCGKGPAAPRGVPDHTAVVLPRLQWCRAEAGCKLDGTRVNLHPVIDNCSRRILSWTLEDRLERVAVATAPLQNAMRSG